MQKKLSAAFMKVSAGSFYMGSSKSDKLAAPNEFVQHQPELEDFYIAKYPITNQDYLLFVESTDYESPNHWANSDINLPELANHPVVHVSHQDALAYCEWRSESGPFTYRLPDEYEWEKAARGSVTDNLYIWGNKWELGRCNSEESGINGTTAVEKFEKKQGNMYEVVDLIGNVWEWTDSWYEAYPKSEYRSSHYGQKQKVVRGGSFRNNYTACRISTRGRYRPGEKRPYVGFRIVKLPLDINLSHLRRELDRRFGLIELKGIAYDIGIDYENLPQKKEEFILELISTAKRRDLIMQILELAHKQRPNVNWYQKGE